MKKLLTLLLIAALTLTACGAKDTQNDDVNNDDNNQVVDTDNTLGDNNGDGNVEDNGENTPAIGDDAGESESESEDAGMEGPAKVTAVTSVDDAIAFIDANVYSQCSDYLPMAMATMALPMEDADMVAYHTGMTDLAGVTDIILSESMVGSFAYSFVMLRTDGTNTAEVQKTLGEKIDPRKWVCVAAEKVSSVIVDNDVILVMGSAEQVDAIMNAVTTAAADVYTNVGSVVNVLG